MSVPSGDAFAHGVASFEPTATSVLVWTRCRGHREVHLEVFSDEACRSRVHRSSHATGPATDHTVTATVDDLAAHTHYWYRFQLDDGTCSAVGRTRTLPGPGADRLRVALVSCSDHSMAPLGVYRALASQDVDAVVHLGDYIYEDESKGRRPHDPPGTVATLDGYRRRYAQMRSDPDLQALHRQHPMLAIWDDHDIADNCWSDGAKAHDPDRHGPWTSRRDAAIQAHREWLPHREPDPDRPERTWRSVPVGDLAELVLLDTRLAGRDRHAGDPDTLGLHDPERTLLGDEQRAWLHDRLADAEQRWSLVCTGVVVNPMDLSIPRPLERVNSLLPNGYGVVEGTVVRDDQWDGYPAERDRLAGAIERRAADGRRTVLLSGDVHSSWAFVGPIGPGGEPVAVEFTTPAVTSKPMGRADWPGVSLVLNRAVRGMDRVAWSNLTDRGYTVVEVTPDAVRADWVLVDPYAEDPAATAQAGGALESRADRWPPALRPVDGAPIGDRHLDDARPADLGSLRRRHNARVWSKGVAAVVAAIGLGAVGWRARRHRRARGGI